MPAGPHGVTGGGRSWIPSITAPSREELANRVEAEVQASIAGVWKVIDDARRRGVECKDITVGGFSQGARIATQLALTAPAECPLGGVVVMSGGGLKELPLPAASGKPKMRVLVTHGRQDGVLAIGDGESTAQHFAAGGHEVRAVWFDGRHEIPTAVRAAIPKFLAGEKVGEAVE
jgi:predicted esterase